ncbi:hypothetical protein [Rathayibacter sp. PhB185]|uniref:hypothetical protein n=1 Tax=Rathayibacter sp. PhB185 TaxID=2485198 RepID=UPI000FAD3411|nr:hypothetical protein [Rathayibacter sp. PhB185]ROP57404.1 hypothetical protein EDF45_0939 [Rathayibacter sp. PhB186]ROS55789.1 hypothetical protein EDF44_0939 [Rathayibacter sp. PhB185]
MTDNPLPQPVPRTEPKTRLSTSSLLIGAAGGFVLGGLFVGGIVAAVSLVGGATGSQSASALTNAVEECVTNTEGAALSDGDRTLTIDSEGEEDFAGLDYSELECLLTETDAPQSVVSHVNQTTSLNGRQTEEWGDVSFSWSYHPDRGADGVFTIAQ